MVKESNKKLSGEKLLSTFLSHVSKGIKYVKGLNPFLIKTNGEEIYVYIKNLSPAFLSNKNPNIWRIQLPIKEVFNDIKTSKNLFLLLGYDVNNEVYTSWNPHWCKQRLNVGKSVSLYSRLSLQVRIAASKGIESQELNNDWKVVCIHHSKLEYYIKNIRKYYPEETEFIPKGSSIQKRKNEMEIKTKVERYLELDINEQIDYIMSLEQPERVLVLFCAANNKQFEFFCEENGVSHKTARRYCLFMSRLLNDGYINKYKECFTKYSTIYDYDKAITEFLQKPDIALLDEYEHGYYKASIRHLLQFLLSKTNKSTQTSSSTKTYPVNEFGQLTAVDSEIREKIKPYILGIDYPDYDKMIEIATKFYPAQINAKMSYADWINLFDKENWRKGSSTTSKSRTQTIVVTRKDGSVIKNSFVADTYLTVIKESFPDLIMELGISHAGVNIVSREYNEKYSKYQKDIGNGFLVMTNSSTEAKYEDLIRINKELDLGLKIELVDLCDKETSKTVGGEKTNGERYKIQVTFPNGKIIKHNKVLETLVEVVEYANPEKVEKLNIMLCYNNLVLNKREEKYFNACKEVSGGLFVNTASNTITKYNQIKEISQRLNLDLKVELI